MLEIVVLVHYHNDAYVDLETPAGYSKQRRSFKDCPPLAQAPAWIF
jgi:hypothetical protein